MTHDPHPPARTLCTCHGIPDTAVARAISRTGTRSLAEVTHITTAGGGCGTCRPEIATLIREITGKEADWTPGDEPLPGGDWI